MSNKLHVIKILLGELVLRNILSQPVFLKSSNGCFIQVRFTFYSVHLNCILKVSGTIVNELVFQKNMKEKTSQFNNKLLSEFISKSISHIQNKTSDYLYSNRELLRSKLFYKSKFEKSIGLPESHMINKVLYTNYILYYHRLY